MKPRSKLHRMALASLLGASMLLAACGGGDEDSSQTQGGLQSAAAAHGQSHTWSQADPESDALVPIDADTFVREQANAASVAVAAAASATLKWNPGHYVMLGAHTLGTIDQVAQQTAKFSFVKGFVIRADWPQLETAKGVYNFALLDTAIARIAAKGKRVFIMVGTKAFSTGGKAVPDYMRTAEYGGGAYRIAIKRGGYGENLALYNDNVRERLIAFNNALAARYNTSNNVEGVVFNETALGMAVTALSEAQKLAFFSNLAKADAAAKASFPNTNVIQFMNSPMKYVPALWNAVTTSQVGGGGPDVYLNDPSMNKLLPNYAASAGKVPIGVAVMEDSYYSTHWKGPFNPPATLDLFNFARTQMHANYIFWVPQTSGPHKPWSRVLNMFNSATFPKDSAGGLPSTCPTGSTCAPTL
jgi:Beta-galactosidase